VGEINQANFIRKKRTARDQGAWTRNLSLHKLLS
jgi:hypothetical protein